MDQEEANLEQLEQMEAKLALTPTEELIGQNGLPPVVPNEEAEKKKKKKGCGGCAWGGCKLAGCSLIATPIIVILCICGLVFMMAQQIREATGTWGQNYEMARHIYRVEEACGSMPTVLWDKALAANGITVQRPISQVTGAINNFFGRDILPKFDSYDADPAASEQMISDYAQCASKVQYQTITQDIINQVTSDTPGLIDYVVKNADKLSQN